MQGSGGLISRMLNDVQTISHGTHYLADLIKEPITGLVVFIYLLTVDWGLVLFLLITLPLVSIIIKNLARSLRKYGHKSMHAIEELTKTMKECLDGSRIVQSYNLQDSMREKFNKQADTLLAAKTKIISREELSGPVSESLTSISLAMILVYVGQQIFKNQMTIGDFMAFFASIAMITDSAKKSQVAFIKLQQSLVALNRYNQILNEGSQVPDTQNPVNFNSDWKEIEFRNVDFHYDEDSPVLKKINLKIKRGDVIALVGPSGGGKSTLVNLLGRFFEATHGQILIDNTPIDQFSLKHYRDQVGLVSQDVFLFSDTIEYNIHIGDFNKTHKDIVKAAQLANAHNFISKTADGYNSLCGERGALFSGGEKQRISIARAILKDASILILDEATSALDTDSEREVQKGLSELMRGRTTFVIAHRLSTVENADRILVLKNGEIIEDGTHSDLFNLHGEYYRLQSL